MCNKGIFIKEGNNTRNDAIDFMPSPYLWKHMTNPIVMDSVGCMNLDGSVPHNNDKTITKFKDELLLSIICEKIMSVMKLHKLTYKSSELIEIFMKSYDTNTNDVKNNSEYVEIRKLIEKSNIIKINTCESKLEKLNQLLTKYNISDGYDKTRLENALSKQSTIDIEIKSDKCNVNRLGTLDFHKKIDNPKMEKLRENIVYNLIVPAIVSNIDVLDKDLLSIDSITTKLNEIMASKTITPSSHSPMLYNTISRILRSGPFYSKYTVSLSLNGVVDKSISKVVTDIIYENNNMDISIAALHDIFHGISIVATKTKLWEFRNSIINELCEMSK